MKNLVITGIILLGISFKADAQQDPQFTQYFDNALFVNPAYAGSKGHLNATAIHREQWAGFSGRPRSTTLNVHSPLKYESIGLGLTAVNDRLGPFNQTMAFADFSYTLRFKNSNAKLSFGVKGGLNCININTSDLLVSDQNDEKLARNTQNHINGNFGLGLYFHTPKFFFGLSSPKILEQSYDGTDKGNIEQRHYYGIIGGVFTLSNSFKLRPYLQAKMTEGAPVSLDASIAGIYADKLWVGVMYRWNAAAGAFVQLLVTPSLKIGLATDIGLKKIRNYNDGTFELMVSYDFFFKKSGNRSPRYF